MRGSLLRTGLLDTSRGSVDVRRPDVKNGEYCDKTDAQAIASRTAEEASRGRLGEELGTKATITKRVSSYIYSSPLRSWMSGGGCSARARLLKTGPES